VSWGVGYVLGALSAVLVVLALSVLRRLVLWNTGSRDYVIRVEDGGTVRQNRPPVGTAEWKVSQVARQSARHEPRRREFLVRQVDE